MRMDELKGEIALVTGSSRGIGAAIATLFAAEGAAVVVHGRDADRAASVAKSVEGTGGRAFPVVADLTRYQEIEAMRVAIEENLGPVSVLVANAGGNPVRPGPIEEITEDGWRDSLEANLTTTFLAIKAFLPGMKERGRGTIVTMSSAASRRPTVMSPAAYGAAKAGIEVLTRQVAEQAGPAGVRASCLAPETIMTERNRAQIPAAVQEQLRDAHPVRRLGTPEDVAQAALFLASERSSWISGITVDVAGGAVLS
jgi:3-oxoacyl-[acyl-carrier protein] reductase